MWSELLAENTIRAAALRTDCSRRNNVPDTLTSAEYEWDYHSKCPHYCGISAVTVVLLQIHNPHPVSIVTSHSKDQLNVHILTINEDSILHCMLLYWSMVA